MLAFTNTQMTKDQLLARLQAHFDADEIIRGQYWRGGRGCAVGCAIHSSDHSLFEPMFGIPRSLAHLQDKIFEGLPNEEAKKFPLEFTRSIREGADLSKVIYKFCAWLLSDPEHGVARLLWDPSLGMGREISTIFNIHTRLALGETVDFEEIEAAARAANRAATRAAPEVARVAAQAAADSAYAARAAVWAAEAAAEAAAGSPEAAEKLHYKVMRDKLLELLREC